MMSSESLATLFVFIDQEAGAPRLVGRLVWHDPVNPEGVVEFVYAQSFLQASDRFALHPLLLPLTRDTYAAVGLAGPLGVFGDATPDAWGKRVLESLEGRTLSVPELLKLSSNGRRVGVLEFSDHDAPDLRYSTHRQLSELLDAAYKVAAREQMNEHDRELLELGSSVGGQHPKSIYFDAQWEWIAKFPAKEDRVNMARVEQATLMLAARCGINTVESRVVSLPGDKDVLLVKRFDRIFTEGRRKRLHYMSCRSVCGLDLHRSGRSYPLFAEEIRRIGVRYQEDCAELFRRMVFNICVGNVDDHALNHGMLLTADGWQLSPAFDVVAGEGTGRGQAMVIGREGATSSIDNALSEISRFGLSSLQANDIVRSVIEGVSQWQELFDAAGVSLIDQGERGWPMRAIC